MGRPRRSDPGRNPYGSVNVRVATMDKVHRIRDQLSGDGERMKVADVMDHVVQHYLDCVGGGATQGNPAHSRTERSQ